MKCPNCDGKGVIAYEGEGEYCCRICGGKGYLLPKDKQTPGTNKRSYLDTIVGFKLEDVIVRTSSTTPPHIIVTMHDTYAKDGIALIDIVGRGNTVEKAAKDFLTQISTKTLVVNPTSKHRREVVIVLADPL